MKTISKAIQVLQEIAKWEQIKKDSANSYIKRKAQDKLLELRRKYKIKI